MRIGPVEGNLVTDPDSTVTVTSEIGSVSNSAALLDPDPGTFLRWNRGGRGVTWIEVDFGSAKDVDTVVLAGLTCFYDTRVRVLFSSSGNFYETLTPNGIGSESGLVHTVGDLDESPDDEDNIVFPTRSGTGNTSAQIQFTNPSGATRGTDPADPLHIYRVRKGRLTTAATGLSSELVPWDGGGPGMTGAFSDGDNAGTFELIANGGTVCELWTDDDEFSSLNSAELYYTKAGTASFYAAVASARIFAAMDVVGYDTYWIDVMPELSSLGLAQANKWAFLNGHSTLNLAARRNVIVPLDTAQSYRYMRVEIDSPVALPIECAHLAAGSSLQPVHGFRPGASSTGTVDTNRVRRTDSGLPRVSLGARRGFADLALNPLPSSEYYLMRGMLDRVGSGQFLWCLPTHSQPTASAGSDGKIADEEWFASVWGTIEDAPGQGFFVRRASGALYRPDRNLRIEEAIAR